MTKKDDFSKQVKELRERLNLTQEQFAERFDIPVANVRNWEQASKGTLPDTAAYLLIGMIQVDPERVAKIIQRVREARALQK